MTVRVLDGDCLAVMPTLDAESVDAIVTDPPYHLTTGKKGGSGVASMNLESPYGRARIGTGFMGKAWDGGDVAFRAETWSAALRVAKPGAYLVAFGGTRTFHRLTCAIEDAGWEIRDCLSWLYGSGFPKSHNGAWGGTALKPAWEPIILARKPLIGTVAANHAAHGTAGLNIDGCRIGTDSTLGPRSGNTFGLINDDGWQPKSGVNGSPSGRWPANVVLDETAAALLDEQSGELSSGLMKADTIRSARSARSVCYGKMPDTATLHDTIGDSGGASRFFYTAKASSAERNAGLDHLPPRSAGEITGRKEGSAGLSNPRASDTSPRQNVHPTVKPLDLMQWLCRLATPKGGLILDPFCGSGSTGRAAIAEGFSFVGIELSPEYAEIARARIAEYAPLFADVDGAA